MSVRSVPTTAWIFSAPAKTLAVVSKAASVPKMRKPPWSRSSLFRAQRLAWSRDCSCWADGTESDRSNRKNTTIPFSGRFHCRPARAKISASSPTRRTPLEAHRRHGDNEASDFHANQTVHATVGGSSRSQ